MRFDLAGLLRVVHHPDAGLRTLHADQIVVAEPVLDGKAGPAEGDRAVDGDVIAVARRPDETRARARQRSAGRIEGLEHLMHGHAERALDKAAVALSKISK